MEDVLLICSNVPRPSVHCSKFGSQKDWARDVHHVSGGAERTLCGRAAIGWLEIERKPVAAAVNDRHLCYKCRSLILPTHLDEVDLRKRLRSAKRRLRYWNTVSPSNTKKSRGEGLENAIADIDNISRQLDKLVNMNEATRAEAVRQAVQKISTHLGVILS